MGAFGRRSSRLGRGARGGGWCWRIGVRDGVFLRSGSVFEEEGSDVGNVVYLVTFLYSVWSRGFSGFVSVWGVFLYYKLYCNFFFSFSLCGNMWARDEFPFLPLFCSWSVSSGICFHSRRHSMRHGKRCFDFQLLATRAYISISLSLQQRTHGRTKNKRQSAKSFERSTGILEALHCMFVILAEL